MLGRRAGEIRSSSEDHQAAKLRQHELQGRDLYLVLTTSEELAISFPYNSTLQMTVIVFYNCFDQILDFSSLILFWKAVLLDIAKTDQCYVAAKTTNQQFWALLHEGSQC